MQINASSVLSLIRAETEEVVLTLESNTTPSVTIGRDPSCELCLQERGISKSHCRIVHREGGWFIEDLGSTNGTLVNRSSTDLPSQIRVERTLKLADGDALELGVARLKVGIQVIDESKTEIIERPPVASSDSARQPSVLTQEPIQASPRLALSPILPAQAGSAEAPSLTSLHADFATLLPFKFLRYKVVKKIGEGGMGVVYWALDEQDRPVAIKFLRAAHNSQEISRFHREMEISRQLKHSAIVRCLDSGHDDGVPFIVMPYCSGGNLSQLLQRSGAIRLKRVVRLADRLLAGLEVAHSLGIVHRDLKPCNILLGQDSRGKYRPMIGDFGLAKLYEQAGQSGMTTDGTVGGSWPYMPREQFTNFRYVTPQCDVWSLGAILYECLSLALPRGPTPKSAPFLAVLNAPIIPLTQVLSSDVPASIVRVIMKALAIEPVDRFKDASQMRRALHRAASIEGIEL